MAIPPPLCVPVSHHRAEWQGQLLDLLAVPDAAKNTTSCLGSKGTVLACGHLGVHWVLPCRTFSAASPSTSCACSSPVQHLALLLLESEA